MIVTDDQTASEIDSMPRTRAEIGEAGVTFDSHVVSMSECCPSRATFLTGRYAHNHGVLAARPPWAFFAFEDAETLPVWLERAGYATGLVGKYMNGYGSEDITYVPPGWTEWHALPGPSTYNYFGFKINHNGKPQVYEFKYQTDLLTEFGEDFIRRRAPEDKPFFLYQAYVAPHEGGPKNLLKDGLLTPVPSALFANVGLGRELPRPPSFNERDVRDKPQQIRRLPRMSWLTIRAVRDAYQRRQAALMSVDVGVARLVRALRESGELENTLLVFTSDNGFIFGEHRRPTGKIVPYEPSIRVPLMLRGPGVPRGERRRQLTWNGDLMPTILALTGARSPWAPDGRSLLPLIRSPRAGTGRSVLLEGPPRRGRNFLRFTGVRTQTHVYVEHRGRPRRELYDLRSDPHQLDNLAGLPRVRRLERALARRLARLRDCAGADCRG